MDSPRGISAGLAHGPRWAKDSMILICASCATRYYADEASIPPQGRVVRCAACGNTWRVEKELVLDNGAAQPATFVDEPKLTREQIERARRSASGAAGSPTAQARARQVQRQRLEKASCRRHSLGRRRGRAGRSVDRGGWCSGKASPKSGPIRRALTPPWASM
ncbi:MAG: MJ0042-type zinc finger domain-containing protein [Alphaproteobacteria bacterium]